MAEPDPQTWTASASDPTNMNDEIQAPLQWLLGHSANPFPHLRWRGATPTTLDAPTGTPPALTGSWTPITLDTVVIDYGFGTPGVIPIDGTYDISAALAIESCISNKALRILADGVVIGQESHPGPGLEVDMATTCTVDCIPLTAGTVITIEGYNDRADLGVPGTAEATVLGEAAPVLTIEYVATAN